MKSLYACIEINKKNNETEDGVTEKIQYYKTKDELYGIEVVKENNLPNKEIKDITEITEDEEEINNILDKLVSRFNGEEILQSSNANGKLPIYKICYDGEDLVLFLSRVGAPACVVQYEEVFAMGLEKLVVFGTCGVLDKSIEDLAIIIPNSAIRDEGTSYHYLKSSREITVNSKYKEEFIKLLKEHNYSYIIGKTWTTDAPYRETKNKISKRKAS